MAGPWRSTPARRATGTPPRRTSTPGPSRGWFWFKGPDGGAHAYAVAGVNGKHLSQAALDLHKFLGNPPINSEAEPFDTSWQDGLAIVDGPCKNVP
jgi:hypothetical protein